MKVGMIFECGPEGADRKVCEHLARQVKPDIEIDSVTLDNKKNLVSEAGKAAARLLKDGCERVVIMWDLHPPWREEAPCRKEDCDDIMRSLAASDVDATKVYLVCIEEELEAWLLADNRAINTVLSKPHRPVRVNRERHPERVNNPKKRLMQIFRQEGRRPYNDLIDAEKIAKAMPDLSRLRRVDTFVRFALKVADVEL
jgi:hypothetical protein